MREQELFVEVVELYKFTRLVAERLSSYEYGMVARLEDDYLNAVLDEHVLHVAIQELDQR